MPSIQYHYWSSIIIDVISIKAGKNKTAFEARQSVNFVTLPWGDQKADGAMIRFEKLRALTHTTTPPICLGVKVTLITSSHLIHQVEGDIAQSVFFSRRRRDRDGD